MASFAPIQPPENLHDCVTRSVALRVIEADRAAQPLVFPNEPEFCRQLGVSRSILREALKVLVDKGLIEIRPRSGMRSRPRSCWNLLDPDILTWQAQLNPDPRFLRDICEVRLAIEPTASGFAAVRALPEEVAAIGECLERREQLAAPANSPEAVDLDLRFYTSVVAASHNPLLGQLSATLREPFRIALSCIGNLPAVVTLGMEANRALFDAIRRQDPMAAREASERIVSYAMVAVEQIARSRKGTV